MCKRDYIQLCLSFGRRTTLPFCRTYVLTARQLFNIPSCPSCCLKTVNLILFPPISICRLEKEYELPYFLSSLEAFQLIQMKKVVPAPARLTWSQVYSGKAFLDIGMLITGGKDQQCLTLAQSIDTKQSA